VTNKSFKWWKSLSEESRREYIKDYFAYRGKTDDIHSLSGLMCEEIEDIWLNKKEPIEIDFLSNV
jgi:hypothetical protein